MPEPKEKPKVEIKTRETKKKNTDIFANLRTLPHPVEEILQEPEVLKTNETSMTSMTSHTTKTENLSNHPVAPEKSYTKVANSIVKEAVPSGVFKGKSKQLYDCLYSLTRGAVVPSRKVRISRPKLMEKAHIGSRATFDSNIQHLEIMGLIKVSKISGEHAGNEYEVFLPEEATMPSLTSLTSLPGYAQKLVRLVRLETSQTRHTSFPIESTTYDTPKTFFKTDEKKNDDDDAFAEFVRVMVSAVEAVTGKRPSKSEAQKWKEIGEILSIELKIAVDRTESVSSIPAFFAEHLRRRLFKKNKRQLDEELKVTGTNTREGKKVLSECPDCKGSGWYYPNGYEKGVERCTHKRLKEG